MLIDRSTDKYAVQVLWFNISYLDMRYEILWGSKPSVHEISDNTKFDVLKPMHSQRNQHLPHENNVNTPVGCIILCVGF